MAMPQRISGAYAQVDLDTRLEAASPHDLIRLLLEGAILRLGRAKEHLLRRNIAKKGEEIGKVISIVAELQHCLSNEPGNEVARHLNTLYEQIMGAVVAANIENDVEKLDLASELLQHLSESWNTIPQEHRG